MESNLGYTVLTIGNFIYLQHIVLMILYRFKGIDISLNASLFFFILER